MRALYEHKRKLVIETIARFFGGRATIFGDNAGINMLVRFDTDLWDTEIMAQARAAGVGISSANQYYQNEAPYGEFLLNYGGLSEEEIVEGLLRLSRIIMPSAFRREPHSSA
jgi:GntR family transcriptional regulator/MocR family aminotransferase